jgi:predicted PurR-regulated permease PerM
MQKASSGAPDPKSLAAPAAAAAAASIEGVASFLVLIVTMLYFSANPDLYTKGLVKLVPEARRVRIREVMGKVAHAWRWWFMGQLVDMLVVRRPDHHRPDAGRHAAGSGWLWPWACWRVC